MTDDPTKTAPEGGIVNRPVRPGLTSRLRGAAAPPPAAAAPPAAVASEQDSRSAPPVAEKSSPGSAERGAAAGRSAAAASEPDPYDMSQYSRRSILDDEGQGQGAFHIPEHLKKAGWDYEFKTTEVMGQPARVSDRALEHRQGWRPAPAVDFAELLPPGYEGRFYEIDGQVLMMRPKSLSAQAKKELQEKADRQKRDKLQSALNTDPAGGVNHDRRMPRTQAVLTLEGEVGVHDQRFDPDQYAHTNRAA